MALRGSLVIMLFLSACSSTPFPTDAGFAPTCALRTGVFRYQETLVSGNCGPADRATSFNLADPTQSPPSMPFYIGEKLGPGGSAQVQDYFSCCSGEVLVSSDRCTIEYSLRAPLKDGGTARMIGKITWASDAQSGSSAMSFTVFDATAAATCSGEYTASVKK